MKRVFAFFSCFTISVLAFGCAKIQSDTNHSNYFDISDSSYCLPQNETDNNDNISSGKNELDLSSSSYVSESSSLNEKSVWQELFIKNKNYSHIFIDDIHDYSKPIIPCESLYDLEIAKRLGFEISEGIIQPTATYGKYVVMHGISGKIGGQLVNLDGTSAADIVIAETTFDDLRNNYKYKSIYEKYQTPIVSLEEWLERCKILGLMPLVSYADDISLGIVKDYFADSFILYGGSRDKHVGMIMEYSKNLSKEQMIYLCEKYGTPFMINVSDISNFKTDSDLIEAIQEIHKRDCLFGICGCYMTGADAIRAWRCGADFSASSSEVNPFDNGDIFDSDTLLSTNDFITDGLLTNGSFSLLTGQSISVSPSQMLPFLHASQLEVLFDGTISISMVGAISVDSVSSNGKEIIRWSGFAINKSPMFKITALSNTRVKTIKYQAKTM